MIQPTAFWQPLRRAAPLPENLMKPFHYVAILSVVAALALFVAGFSGAAGFALVLGTAVEIVGAMITGKQGNDTER
ncbi:hypothetical protein ACINB_45420 [Acidovorax sp. NB1]|nr:hypothetical protein ACINB_45420 [Acidovorax sp. NB1]